MSCNDEIERVADLSKPKSIPTLSVLRDIINILTSDDSLPKQRGIMSGLFVVYAISTFLLGYSGIINRAGVDFGAQVDKYSRPKVTLLDVPRLGTVLKDSASTIYVGFDSIEDLKNVAAKIIACYSNTKKVSVTQTPDELARYSYDTTQVFLARSNVMAIIKYLDQNYS